MSHGSTHHSVIVIVIGGGQSGLSLSHYLKQRGIGHLVLEKHEPAHSWRARRWDSFCLVTPNWQRRLPGWEYRGSDPHGFMVKSQIIEYLEGSVRHVDAPLSCGVTVQRVAPRPQGGFDVHTDAGHHTAGQLVVASGGYYHQPTSPPAHHPAPGRTPAGRGVAAAFRAVPQTAGAAATQGADGGQRPERRPDR